MKKVFVILVLSLICLGVITYGKPQLWIKITKIKHYDYCWFLNPVEIQVNGLVSKDVKYVVGNATIRHFKTNKTITVKFRVPAKYGKFGVHIVFKGTVPTKPWYGSFIIINVWPEGHPELVITNITEYNPIKYDPLPTQFDVALHVPTQVDVGIADYPAYIEIQSDENVIVSGTVEVHVCMAKQEYNLPQTLVPAATITKINFSLSFACDYDDYVTYIVNLHLVDPLNHSNTEDKTYIFDSTFVRGRKELDLEERAGSTNTTLLVCQQELLNLQQKYNEEKSLWQAKLTEAKLNYTSCLNRYEALEDSYNALSEQVGRLNKMVVDTSNRLATCTNELTNVQVQLSSCRAQISEYQSQSQVCEAKLKLCENEKGSCQMSLGGMIIAAIVSVAIGAAIGISSYLRYKHLVKKLKEVNVNKGD